MRTKEVTIEERELLYLYSLGNTCKEIAPLVFFSHRTVETKLQRVTLKLGARNTPHAVAIAIRKKIIP